MIEINQLRCVIAQPRISVRSTFIMARWSKLVL
jgi:hypothetical protein